MQINDNWRITSDPLNVILQRRVVGKTKDGEPRETWEAEGYYGTVEQALSGLAKREILATELTDLKTVCKKIAELEATIKKACKGR